MFEVSTTVVEVEVNRAQCNRYMVIMDADQFGVANFTSEVGLVGKQSTVYAILVANPKAE